MNRHTAWRDLWLVLTIVTTSLALLASGLVLAELLQDPAHLLAIALRTDGLATWPPQPDMDQLILFAPPALAVLASRFHRFYQEAQEACASREPVETIPGSADEHAPGRTAPREP